jgi:hypothetical protein
MGDYYPADPSSNRTNVTKLVPSSLNPRKAVGRVHSTSFLLGLPFDKSSMFIHA